MTSSAAASAFSVNNPSDGGQSIKMNSYHSLTGRSASRSLCSRDVAPSSIHLAGAEVELVGISSREHRLRDALRPVREWYEFIFIDCPPSLGLLTLNALAAADEVIVPIQCEYYALEGLSQLLDSLTLIRRQLNPGLRINGALLTMYDGRTNLSEHVVAEVQRHFRGQVFATIIPRNVRLAEAPSFGRPRSEEHTSELQSHHDLV